MFPDSMDLPLAGESHYLADSWWLDKDGDDIEGITLTGNHFAE
jgi:hypothetical protein